MTVGGDDARRVIEELQRGGPDVTVPLEGYSLRLTNLDHVLWPEASDGPITKREFLAYLAAMSPRLLHHARDRIVTLAGYRDASSAPLYFQRHREHPPEFVETVRAFAESYDRDQTYLLCNNLPTLLWLGQINNLALHVSLFRVVDPTGARPAAPFTGAAEAVEQSVLQQPDVLLFDLDPYIYSGAEHEGETPRLNRVGWDAVREVAFALKELLDAVGLPSFVKTSGATGLHVVVPAVRSLRFETMQALCADFARELQARRSDVTTDWAVQSRRGRVFVDCRQNGYSKSIAAPYSPRAQPDGTVSMPLAWTQLESAYPTDFTMRSVFAQIATVEDPWAGLLDAAVDLEAAVV